jgi:hypothetical protein
VISAYLCLACVRSFVLHARQWVRRAPGIPCALFIPRAEPKAKSGREPRRGKAKPCLYGDFLCLN